MVFGESWSDKNKEEVVANILWNNLDNKVFMVSILRINHLFFQPGLIMVTISTEVSS